MADFLIYLIGGLAVTYAVSHIVISLLCKIIGTK